MKVNSTVTTGYLALAITAMALSGCGGSDSGASSVSSSSVASSSSSSIASSSSSSVEAQAPLVSAGDNKEVSAGETVSLQAQVSDDGGISSQYWQQLSGARVPMTELSDTQIEFTAPSTGGADSTSLQFEFVATDNDGLTSRDSVAVTVARVNQSPVVEVDRFLTVQDQVQILLSANIYDPDGEVQSVSWQQLDGPSVELQNASTTESNFLVPNADSEQRFRFRVTATDNEGASQSDAMTVVVTKAQAPRVVLQFPPERGWYQQGDIDVTGVVEVAEGASPETVLIQGGVEDISVAVSESGKFRASDVVLPSEAGDVTLTVTALDSEGRSGYAQTQIFQGEDLAVGGGARWVQSTAIILAPDGNEAWVLSEGEVNSDIALMSIDLATGYRELAVTDFAEEADGPVLGQYSDMVYDSARQEFYLAGWNEVIEQQDGEDVIRKHGGVITVDAVAGARRDEIVASGDTGFIQPRGLLLHNEQLFIADPVNGQLFQKEPDSVEANVIAGDLTVAEPLSAPAQVAWSEAQNELLVLEQGSTAVDLLGLDLTVEPVTSRLVSEGADVSFGPMPMESALGFSVDQQTRTGYVLTEVDNGITAIDLQSGERQILVQNLDPRGAASADMVYSAERNLLYVVGGANYYQQLLVVEPLSGDRVVLSSSQF